MRKSNKEAIYYNIVRLDLGTKTSLKLLHILLS